MWFSPLKVAPNVIASIIESRKKKLTLRIWGGSFFLDLQKSGINSWTNGIVQWSLIQSALYHALHPPRHNLLRAGSLIYITLWDGTIYYRPALPKDWSGPGLKGLCHLMAGVRVITPPHILSSVIRSNVRSYR